MILSDRDIRRLLKSGKMKISPLEDEQIGPSSIDLTLSNEWQFFKTEELRSQLASALVQLVGTFCQLGNYKSALPYAQRWLQIDPLHEAAHRQLMHIYAWTGQRSAALRQFDECAKVIEEELGVAPEDETIQVYQIIKSKQKIPATVETSLVKSTMSEHNLPLQTTPFIGRESELAEPGYRRIGMRAASI